MVAPKNKDAQAADATAPGHGKGAVTPMQETLYPVARLVQCRCGWTDSGTLTLTPAEPGGEDYEVAPVVSTDRCGQCDELLLHDTVVARRRRQPFRTRRVIRDRHQRCARVGAA